MGWPAAAWQTGADGWSSGFSPGSDAFYLKLFEAAIWHLADGFWFRRPAAGTALVRFYPRRLCGWALNHRLGVTPVSVLSRSGPGSSENRDQRLMTADYLLLLSASFG